jgi:DNA repair exonuclease SbcCD ATPase subunit
VAEAEANANDKEPQASLIQEPWHDKVLVDAIGYTKGLVAILDSLTEGFQRRGRELEEQRHRLAILQSERRTILEARSGFDAQVTFLTAERDALRTQLEERQRELDALRQEVAKAQVSLESHTHEIQELRRGVAEPAQQAEELREVVRSLERQLQRAGLTAGRAPVVPPARDAATPSDVRTTSQTDLAGLEELLPDRQVSETSQMTALTAERDALRTQLEERVGELETLRQEAAQGKAALEAHTREIQALRVGMAETVRQAEEIQRVLQGLEQERERAAQRQGALEAELEAERRRVRETTTRASQEQIALREDLADAENLLAEARKDIAAGQGLIASLRRTVDEQRSQSASLEEQLQSSTSEVSRLNAAMHSAQKLFAEISRALGGGAGETGAKGHEWAELEALVQDVEAGTQADQGAFAMLQPIAEVFRDLWHPAEHAGGGPSQTLAGDATVRERAEQIADQWRRLLQDRVESARTASPLQGEPGVRQGEATTTKGEREPRREAQPAVTTRDRRPLAGEGVRGGKPEPLPIPASASVARQKTAKRRGVPSGMTVECMLVASGKEVPRILRGEIGRINNMGMMGAFDERFPEGRQVVLRFVREGEVVACLGRVVRVQESGATPDSSGAFNHLIRFESPLAISGEALQAFAT